MQRNIRQKNLLKYFWLILLVSVLSLLPTLTYASCTAAGICTDTSNGAFFTPAPNDLSIVYLGELFGNIPPVLAGTGSQLLGDLFKLFNMAVLTLGILFAGYTTFVGILNTAGEGEVLGKGWSSIWVPIRTVAGIALLIPTTSGYCVCQVFMMWLLVQGIGAADTLTGSIIDYMEKGEKIFVKGNAPDGDGNMSKTSAWDSTIKTVYQGLSCMQSYQKEFPTVNDGYITPPSAISKETNPIVYNFIAHKQDGTNIDGTPKSVEVSCGKINIKNAAGNEATAATYITQGLETIMPSLNAAAYFMVNDDVSAITDPAAAELQAMTDTFNFVGADFMNEAATTYNSYVKQAENALAPPSSDKTSYYEDIRSYGWITLGNLYWDMAGSSGVSDNSTVKTNATLTWDQNYQNIGDIHSTSHTSWNDGYIYTTTALKYGHTWASQFIDDLVASRDNDNNGSNSFQTVDNNDLGEAASGFISHITLTTLQTMQEKLNSNENPMISAQKLGHQISFDIEAALTALMVFMTTAALIAGNMSSVSSLYLMFQTILNMALPGLMVFTTMMLVLSGTLSVTIPFIPALAFFLAVVAWMIAALETIVAAPIVAIGVIHPEGHAVWGKAEPAIMLMTNMFLRPSLMVMGMAAGVILSFITVQFVNFGYSQAMGKLLDGGGYLANRPTSMEATLFLGTYVALILACVNKSFSTIDVLPESVMRWIQGGEATKFGGGQEAMQKVQGAQESAGQKGGGDATSSGQESAQAGEKGAGMQDKQVERRKLDKEANKDPLNLGKGRKGP